MTPAGGALIVVLAAALIVLARGPEHDRVPALVVIAVSVAMFVLPGGGTRTPWGRSLDERRQEIWDGGPGSDPGAEREED